MLLAHSQALVFRVVLLEPSGCVCVCVCVFKAQAEEQCLWIFSRHSWRIVHFL